MNIYSKGTRMRIGISAGLVALAILAVLMIGCTKKTSGPAGKAGNQAAGPSTASPENRKDIQDMAGQDGGGSTAGSEIFGAANARKVTPEELKTLTKFGPFLFPDATLVEEKSRHQSMPDGTETYTLELGTSAPLSSVAQWYKNHLESGYKSSSHEMPDGSTLAGYEYQAPDKSWAKTITIKGYPSQTASTITVFLMGKGEAAKKPETTGGGH